MLKPTHSGRAFNRGLYIGERSALEVVSATLSAQFRLRFAKRKVGIVHAWTIDAWFKDELF